MVHDVRQLIRNMDNDKLQKLARELECREEHIHKLSDFAADMRFPGNEWKNPFTPGIPCAGCQDAPAIEGAFFCSHSCKTAYEKANP